MVEQKEPYKSDKESSRASDCCTTEEDQEEEANLSLKRWLRLKTLAWSLQRKFRQRPFF